MFVSVLMRAREKIAVATIDGPNTKSNPFHAQQMDWVGPMLIFWLWQYVLRE